MALTDLQVKKAQPKEKPYKLVDGLGLHLQVTTTRGDLGSDQVNRQKC